MKYAEREIDNAFRGQKNRMMNLVEQSWAEGKRNAEIDGVTSIVKGVLDNLSNKDEQILMYQGKQLVRCKECKHWESNDGRYGFCQICHTNSSSNGWFCADGELAEQNVTI